MNLLYLFYIKIYLQKIIPLRVVGYRTIKSLSFTLLPGAILHWVVWDPPVLASTEVDFKFEFEKKKIWVSLSQSSYGTRKCSWMKKLRGKSKKSCFSNRYGIELFYICLTFAKFTRK